MARSIRPFSGAVWSLLIIIGLTIGAGCSLFDDSETATTASTVASETASSNAASSTGASSNTLGSSNESPPTTASPPANFADSFAEVSSGVFRIDATYCDGGQSVGTGFLLNPTLLLTAAHVTGDASVVEVSRDDRDPFAAAVVGADEARDLVLLELSEPSEGHPFELYDGDIRVGDEVAALGHPRSLPLTFTSGRVSSVDFEDAGVLFHQTDAPINPGNSGGPLIDQQGRVIGMADWKFTDVEGISFVVASSEILDFLESDQSQTIGIELGCGQTEPGDEFTFITDDPQLAAIPVMFDNYAQLINDAMEGLAYDRFAGPRLRGIVTREAFIDGNSTSILEDMRVYNVLWLTEQTAEAWVTFVSYQDPVYGTDGQSCSVWDLTYELILEADAWKIERATNEPGSPTAC